MEQAIATKRRRARAAAAIVGGLVLLAVGAAAYRAALDALRTRIEGALGKGAEVAALRVGWRGVELAGLRVAGDGGDALLAERVVVVPSLRSLWSGGVDIASLTVVGGYLRVSRTRDGALHAGSSSDAGDGAGPAVTVHRLRLEGSAVELLDASVATPPLRVRLEALDATVEELRVPAHGRTRLEVAAVVRGRARDGRLRLAGWVDLATRDSSLRTELRGIDLVALQPYLVRATETRVRRGFLDLDLESEVRAGRLRAPGRLAIAELEFAEARGALDSFLGLPRSGVVALLERSGGGRIDVHFRLEGDVAQPSFILDEGFTARVAAALGNHVGVSVRDVAVDAADLGRRGAAAVGEAGKRVGGAFRRLVGGR